MNKDFSEKSIKTFMWKPIEIQKLVQQMQARRGGGTPSVCCCWSVMMSATICFLLLPYCSLKTFQCFHTQKKTRNTSHLSARRPPQTWDAVSQRVNNTHCKTAEWKTDFVNTNKLCSDSLMSRELENVLLQREIPLGHIYHHVTLGRAAPAFTSWRPHRFILSLAAFLC